MSGFLYPGILPLRIKNKIGSPGKRPYAIRLGSWRRCVAGSSFLKTSLPTYGSLVTPMLPSPRPPLHMSQTKSTAPTLFSSHTNVQCLDVLDLSDLSPSSSSTPTWKMSHTLDGSSITLPTSALSAARKVLSMHNFYIDTTQKSTHKTLP